MHKHGIFLGACVVVGTLATHHAHAGSVVIGVNAWYQPAGVSEDDMVLQLAANGVKTIRRSLFLGNADFVVKACSQGIGTVAIIYPHTGATAKPKRSWADVPLSQLKPQEFAHGFSAIMSHLEAAGVRLTTVELGNEINNPGFNGDLPNPGTGRVLGLADLNNPKDHETPAIAAGFRSYIQVAATLKDIRDHSKLNQRTPIVAAGMSPWGPPHDYPAGRSA